MRHAAWSGCLGSRPDAEVQAPARRHLRDLLRDAERSDMLYEEHNKIIADFSRQRVTKKTLEVRCAGATAWSTPHPGSH